MTIEDDFNSRICPSCHVALLFPIRDEVLAGQGWYSCTFCGYCLVLEKEIYENRTKNQK